MDITISFRDGKKMQFLSGTVVGYKYSDRTFCIITDKEKTMHIYNMSTINDIRFKVKEGSVKDYMLE